jgi:hypothetical protein
MTLSGPKACLGSTKDVKILAAFLHSPIHMGEGFGLAGGAARQLRGSGHGRSGHILLKDDGSGL